MQLTPGEIISLLSVLVVLIFNMISLRRMTIVASKGDTEQITRISMQIAEVQRGVDEIKTEIKDMKDDIKEDHDAVIILQRDVTTLWKRVDEERGIAHEN